MKMMILKLQSDGQAGRAEVSFSRDELLAVSLIEKRKGIKPWCDKPSDCFHLHASLHLHCHLVVLGRFLSLSLSLSIFAIHLSSLHPSLLCIIDLFCNLFLNYHATVDSSVSICMKVHAYTFTELGYTKPFSDELVN